MQQQFRMRKNGHFQRVYKKGKPASAREITLLYLKGPKLLAGFSVSKKVGGAVAPASWLSPESASNSPRMPITGFPLPKEPQKAVSMPPSFSVTAKPSYLLKKQQLYQEQSL